MKPTWVPHKDATYVDVGPVEVHSRPCSVAPLLGRLTVAGHLTLKPWFRYPDVMFCSKAGIYMALFSATSHLFNHLGSGIALSLAHVPVAQ